MLREKQEKDPVRGLPGSHESRWQRRSDRALCQTARWAVTANTSGASQLCGERPASPLPHAAPRPPRGLCTVVVPVLQTGKLSLERLDNFLQVTRLISGGNVSGCWLSSSAHPADGESHYPGPGVSSVFDFCQ